MKILFLTRSLHRGGAETQLVQLAAGLAERGHEVCVAVYYSGGALESELAGRGVRLHDLGKRGRWDLPGFAARLVRLVRRERPDVLHAYLTTANLLAASLGLFFPRTRIVWGVRATDMRGMRKDGVASLTMRLETLLARRSDLIITNSRASASRLAAHGVDKARIAVVANGIDTSRFAPSPDMRSASREAWGIPAEAVAVGLPARLDPVKDHATFLRAAKCLLETDRGVHFLCAGGGEPGFAAGLRELAASLGIDHAVHWLGEMEDMRKFYAGLDLAVLSSTSESFPNVLCEAMACGVPCVATDVGDCALIVGEEGITVRPGDPEALAKAMQEMIGRIASGSSSPERVRERVETLFGLDTMVRRSEELLMEISARQAGPKTMRRKG